MGYATARNDLPKTDSKSETQLGDRAERLPVAQRTAKDPERNPTGQNTERVDFQTSSWRELITGRILERMADHWSNLVQMLTTGASQLSHQNWMFPHLIWLKEPLHWSLLKVCFRLQEQHAVQ